MYTLRISYLFFVGVFLFFQNYLSAAVQALAASALPPAPIAQPVNIPSVTQEVVVTNDHCQIPGFYGVFPREIGVCMQELQKINSDEGELVSLRESDTNRLLLYGPPGTGKTKIAEQFGPLTGSDVLSIRTPEVVTSYLNSGAQAIGKVVGDIEKRFKEKKNNVLIVFFDEIDALSAPRNESNTNQLDTVRAMQSLWLGLTKYESEPQIFFIFNTNHLTLLPATFLDRFKSQRIIKIDKPNKDNRRAQLYGFLHAHGLTRLNRNLFDRHAYEIMQKIGDCEELQQYKQPLQDLQQHLVRIDNAMIQGNALDVMDKLIQHVEDKTAQIDKLLIVERPTNVKLVAEVKQLVATYLRFVSRYLLKIKAQYKNPAKQIAVNIVEHIVEKTEGLSTRGVADIAYIMGEALIKGAPINIELANKAISGAVEKMRFKEQEDNKKLRDERIKDMQLEEAENKKKQRRLENLIGYLRLLAEIRGSCNGTYNAGFMGVGGTQNFLINDILKSYGYSKEDRKTIASQISRSVAIAFAELKSRGKEIAEGK